MKKQPALITLLLLLVLCENADSSNDTQDSVVCNSGDANNQECTGNGDNTCIENLAAAESSIDTNLLSTNEDNGPKTKEKPQFKLESDRPKEMHVIFKNKSERKIKLFWKGFNGEKVLQAEMDSPSETVINTFYGHEFFYTPYDNEDEILYSVRMENHIDMVQLLTKEEMAQRNKEFEIEKNNFMKNYYEKTGRRWKNYYPRDPVTHFMYNITNIGQILLPKTNYTKYNLCPNNLHENNEEFILLVNKLIKEEEEYSSNEFLKLNEERLKREEKDKDDRNYFHHIPVYKSFIDYFENNDYNLKILQYNGTTYCQDLNKIDEIIPMEVLCNEPRVVSINNFLSSTECSHIIEVGNYLGLRRSTVSESAIKSLDRTSSTVWLERKFSPIIDNVVKRIANVLKIDPNLLHLNASSESLQFVHYLDGELYRPHVDYGTDLPNNRFITFLMYLNNVNIGGNTSFPSASNECKGENDYFGIHPKKGNAAWFYDLFEDGNVDSTSLHYAEPPSNNSEKFMTNLWIWDPFFK